MSSTRSDDPLGAVLSRELESSTAVRCLARGFALDALERLVSIGLLVFLRVATDCTVRVGRERARRA
jgi:hypothetical protein